MANARKSMTSNKNYLTESKLGDILTKIFPTAQIKKQYALIKFGNRKKFDFCVVLDVAAANKMSSILKVDSDKLINSMLLIEFDGHYHYISGAKVVSDMKYGAGNCEWKVIDTLENDKNKNVYGLRIPFYLQIDSTLSKLFFNDGQDYSDDFPQGFITEKCTLPESFSSMGEKRFLKEVSLLPKEILRSIVDSLSFKIGDDTTTEMVISNDLFLSLKKLLLLK